jgi:hypothetical protein
MQSQWGLYGLQIAVALLNALETERAKVADLTKRLGGPAFAADEDAWAILRIHPHSIPHLFPKPWASLTDEQRDQIATRTGQSILNLLDGTLLFSEFIAEAAHSVLDTPNI